MSSEHRERLIGKRPAILCRRGSCAARNIFESIETKPRYVMDGGWRGSEGDDVYVDSADIYGRF